MCKQRDTKPARYGRVGSLRTCLITMALLLGASAAQAQYAVTASWSPNTDSNTAGYRLYYGTSAGNYQWSIDVGNQTMAPVNLSPGNYYFVVRAYDALYAYGPPSAEVFLRVGPPTAEIQVSLQSGTTVLIAWQTTNAMSATLNGQAVPLNGSSTQPISATTTFTLRAMSSTGQTAQASATVLFASNLAPLPPVNLAATTTASLAVFTWQWNPAGGAPTDYLLIVSAPMGGPVLARLVGNVLSFSAQLPPGQYQVRVMARNASGMSDASNVVSFSIR